LLTDPNYRWPADLPFVRVPKTRVKELRPQIPFNFRSGSLNETVLELLAITREEKAPTEQALGGYGRGVDDLMAGAAYETNMPATQPGRLTKTVIVPPLGGPLKDLAEETRAQLTAVLGREREKLLFGGWEEGAIQIFSPGNLSKISENSQTFTAWVEPNGGQNGEPQYGTRWKTQDASSSATGHSVIFNQPIAERFFRPWLEQFGIHNFQ
jgi:hypothetical protein